MKIKKQSRREFIKKSAGTIAGITAFPYIIPSSIIGKNKFISPSGNELYDAIQEQNEQMQKEDRCRSRVRERTRPGYRGISEPRGQQF